VNGVLAFVKPFSLLQRSRTFSVRKFVQTVTASLKPRQVLENPAKRRS
jgi:hypothetical protein